MNWLYPLTIVYVSLLLAAFLVFRKRLLSPSVIFLGSFAAMLICCSAFNWYFKFNIKPEAFGIMSAAAVVFFLTELSYASCLRTRSRKLYVEQPADLNDKHGSQPVIVSKKVLNALIVIMFICVGLALLNLFLQTEGRSWHELMNHYYHMRRYTKGVAAWRFTAINQLFNIAIALAYVNTYVLIYNKIVCNLSIRQQARSVAIDLLFVPFAMIALSARQSVVELVVYACMLSVLLLQLNGRKLNFKKSISSAGVILTAMFILFALTGVYVGRTNKFKDISGIFDYIGLYLCGGLYNFNDNVGKVFSHMYWGENTFAHLYSFLAKFGLVPAAAVKTYHAFGYKGGATTVTFFGRWYEDFGAVGVYIMTALVALAFAYLFYSKILPKTVTNIFHIIYLLLASVLVWASYDDRIYALIAVGNVAKFFWIFFFYRWLVSGKGEFLRLTSKVKFVISKK